MISLFKRTATTRLLFFVTADIASVIFSIWLAFLIRFDGDIPATYEQLLLRVMVLAVVFIIPTFYFQRLYSFTWSYVSTNEIISLFRATTTAFVFLAITLYVSTYFPYFQNFPRSTMAISYVLVFILCGGTRLAKKIYLAGRGGIKHHASKDRTLIVGAGDAGEQISRNILSLKGGAYFPVGFVDDSKIKQNVKIHGIPVLGRINDIPELVKEHDIGQLIIALPSAGTKTIRQAVELGRQAGLWKIKIAPPMNEIIRGEVSLRNLRDIDVEDLLGRESVSLDKKQLEQFVRQQVVLITGAAGSIGSELARQVAKFQPELLVVLDQDETGIFNISQELKKQLPQVKMQPCIADVTDKKMLRDIFSRYKPSIVFHAAAYKHVPLMESNSLEAVKNNIFGTKNVAEAAVEAGAKKFIFISTDKAINPTSVMGATKRIGEMVCSTASEKGVTAFVSVRFGNVLNSRGSVIPIFKEQIRKGGPIEVTHPEMKRYFMLNSEACLLVMQAGAMGKGGEVFVLDMGEPIKILDLAKEMIRLSGYKSDEDMPIVFTGVRPGEKLFEEIMSADEGTMATQNQSIFITKLSPVGTDFLDEQLELLAGVLAKGDAAAIKTVFKALIPSYVLE